MEVDLCTGCDFNYNDLCVISVDKDRILQLCVAHQLLRLSTVCTNCNVELPLNSITWSFRCNRVIPETGERCLFKQSAKKGTLFHRATVPVDQIIKLIYLWLSPGRTVARTAHELRWSHRTVVSWFATCREVVTRYFDAVQQPIGGEGKVVEVLETQLGKKRQCKKTGELIEELWVIGGVERGATDAHKVFFIPVEDRSADTLTVIISEWVLPGSTIVTNANSAYREIELLGYYHLQVNRARLVDQTTGAHTQTIVRKWRDLKGIIPEAGTRREYIHGYIAEALFKSVYPTQGKRFHNFLNAMGQFHPPV